MAVEHFDRHNSLHPAMFCSVHRPHVPVQADHLQQHVIPHDQRVLRPLPEQFRLELVECGREFSHEVRKLCVSSTLILVGGDDDP